jgi:hypothetical protein
VSGLKYGHSRFSSSFPPKAICKAGTRDAGHIIFPAWHLESKEVGQARAPQERTGTLRRQCKREKHSNKASGSGFRCGVVITTLGVARVRDKLRSIDRSANIYRAKAQRIM